MTAKTFSSCVSLTQLSCAAAGETTLILAKTGTILRPLMPPESLIFLISALYVAS
jgi:hypothetical protein